jgi:hypothetical protein
MQEGTRKLKEASSTTRSVVNNRTIWRTDQGWARRSRKQKIGGGTRIILIRVFVTLTEVVEVAKR